MIRLAAFVLLGLAVGGLSGLVGLGGGVFLVPALVLLAGFSQHQAVGTALAAMVPPVTLAAAAEYYRQGYINLKIALLLAVTIAIGSWATAHFAHRLPEVWLQRLFGITLLIVAVRLLVKQ